MLQTENFFYFGPSIVNFFVACFFPTSDVNLMMDSDNDSISNVSSSDSDSCDGSDDMHKAHSCVD